MLKARCARGANTVLELIFKLCLLRVSVPLCDVCPDLGVTSGLRSMWSLRCFEFDLIKRLAFTVQMKLWIAILNTLTAISDGVFCVVPAATCAEPDGH